jgi:hypothetical protein
MIMSFTTQRIWSNIFLSLRKEKVAVVVHVLSHLGINYLKIQKEYAFIFLPESKSINIKSTYRIYNALIFKELAKFKRLRKKE